MARPLFKHVKSYRDRHGRWRHYFRRRGFQTVTLPGPLGSAEFAAAYRAALAGETAPEVEVGAGRSASGTVDHVVRAYLASPVFAALAAETRRSRRGILEGFAKAHGTKPLYYATPGGSRTMLLTRSHVQTIVNEKAARPWAQRNFLAALKAMFDWAVVNSELLPENPAVGIRCVKLKTDGYRAWEQCDVDRFIARHPLGTKAYLALILLLDTGQRGGDVHVMGRQHVRDGVLSIKQSKTGSVVEMPVTARLAEAIAAHPSGQLTFLVADRTGAPFTRKGFGGWFRDRCNEAGLPGGKGGFSAHGLRKTRATMLADAGASEHQIAAVTGHRSIGEVQRYTRSANRKRLAAEAMAGEVTDKTSTKTV